VSSLVVQCCLTSNLSRSSFALRSSLFRRLTALDLWAAALAVSEVHLIPFIPRTLCGPGERFKAELIPDPPPDRQNPSQRKFQTLEGFCRCRSEVLREAASVVSG